MRNSIIRFVKARYEKFWGYINNQVKIGRLKSIAIFISIIAAPVIFYFIWNNIAYISNQESSARENEQSYLANIIEAVGDAFADMFTSENDNLLAEISRERGSSPTGGSVSALPFVTVNKTSIYKGEVITKSGSGFASAKNIALFISSPSEQVISIATLTTDSRGEFHHIYSVSDKAEVGIYHYWAEDKIDGVITDKVRYLVALSAAKNIPQQEDEKVLPDNTGENNERNQNENITPLALPKECSFEGEGKASGAKQVVLNEIAWMGSTAGASNEWIELKNISPSMADISGWWLIDKASQIKIIFPNNTLISSGRFYLLERTDDDSALNVKADMIYTGALSNNDEGIRLLNPDCLIKDEALANPSWPAGKSDSRQTMERKSDLSGWHTSLLRDGTPKQENSAGVLTQSGGASASLVTLREGESGETQTGTTQPNPHIILISEVKIAGDTSTQNDFIELYNPNPFPVNLGNYRLVKRTERGNSDSSIKAWGPDVYIPAMGFYLWANSGYTDMSAMANSTTMAIISNNNGVAIRFGAANTGTIIDSVSWGNAQDTFIEGAVFSINPRDNQSIQRKFQNNAFIDTNNNANDFETQNCPSPKSFVGNCHTRIEPTVAVAEVIADISWPAFAGTVSLSDGTKVLWSGEGNNGKSRITIQNPKPEQKLYFEVIRQDGTSISKQKFFIMTFQNAARVQTNTNSVQQVNIRLI